MKKTKIICTLGPSTSSEKVMKSLLKEGMNVARLNFSHGDYEDHERMIKLFKKCRDDLKIPSGLLLDTRGPEIRIREFEKGMIELKAGDIFTFTTRDIIGSEGAVSVTYSGLPKDVSLNSRILLDDGLMEFVVTEVNETDIRCEVINGGVLSNNKGVNIPDVAVNLPYLSEVDKRDILFGLSQGIEYIAASFVRNENCVKSLREFLYDNDCREVKIISKIENREGVDNIDSIISVSDGIMVARGDMGVEIPFEELPAIQKMIIKKCNETGVLVITATQMLDSMIRNPRPTRAEITDVANAIYDGTSAIMLSGETSVGRYPIEALKTMSKIAIEAENDIDYQKRFNNAHVRVSRNVTNAISHATCSTAHVLGASAIISVTKSGHTARMVSKYRPDCPIIATTVTELVYHQLALVWGVTPLLTPIGGSTDEIFEQAIKQALKTSVVRDGDLVVITGGIPVGVSGTTNTLKVHVVGDVLMRGKGSNNLVAKGNLCVVHETHDAKTNFSIGDVLVIERTTDELLPLLKHASAIITEEDSEYSKSVIIGKTLEIPVITNAVDATNILKSGIVATVDAGKGLVFSGVRLEQ